MAGLTSMKRGGLFLVLAGAMLVAGLVMTTRVLSGASQADVPAFSAANALVDAGHYAEAVQMYEQLAAQGAANAALVYNLGNAYFLQGDANRARDAYERAAQLAPRDADIRHNLELARDQAPGTTAGQPAGLLAELSETTSHWLTVDELALIALGAWFLFGFLVVASRHFQPGKRPAALRVLAAIALVAVILTGTALLGSVVA